MVTRKVNNKKVNDERILPLICDTIYNHLGVKVGELKKKSRKRCVCEPRQIACTLAWETGKVSQSFISNYFGYKDHSTVNHAITTVNDMYDTNRLFKRKLDRLRDSVNKRISTLYSFDINLEIYNELKNQL